MLKSSFLILFRANDCNDSHKNLNHVKDHPSQFVPHNVTTASTDNPNVVPPLRLATRKRPLSEKIDYSDMIAEETEIKRGRGKARAKSGGGTRGGGAGRGRGGGGAGGRVMDDVVSDHNKNNETDSR